MNQSHVDKKRVQFDQNYTILHVTSRAIFFNESLMKKNNAFLRMTADCKLLTWVWYADQHFSLQIQIL